MENNEMKKFVLLLTAGVFAASLATSANAGEVIKPLAVNKSVATVKSTRATPLFGGLGGYWVVPVTGVIIFITLSKSTSGT
jgi:hypothetical protein